ncbi:glycoside hydrolase family 3 N-terminal domain-containing protein [Pedobacter sp.]
MKLAFGLLLISIANNVFAQNADKFVTDLMSKMTLEEKIGQLNQYSGEWANTGPVTKDGDKQGQIRRGQVGAMLNVTTVKQTTELQKMAMESRLKIPLLFGQDVIHGYRINYPIPLAEAPSWDMQAIEKSARYAAVEAAAYGIHWTFAPMVDIGRDPRWGRVMEGAGEDPYLGSLVAKARVKGFQGKGLGSTDALMACAKHFAAYGAAIGGRDYNSVDISVRQLYETYLPPFKAAADEGVATFMNAFNDLNGIPATGSKFLQREILKKQWNYKGFVVSDWGSIGEMIQHGYAKDHYEAALKAIVAGSDMDMESRSYKNHLAQLVTDGKVDVALIDEAVRRILTKKYELGLFDNPFKFSDQKRQDAQSNNPLHRKHAREIAAKSIVLLKNEKQLLPLSKSTKNIALIGPFGKAISDNLGFWSTSWPDDNKLIVPIYDGLKNQLSPDSKLVYAKGCNVNDSDKSQFEEAIQIAKNADVVIMTLGEAANMSGEAKSRSSIRLPGVQEDLLKEIHKIGKPIVLLISAGRPLIFNWAADNIESIAYTWWLGTEAGNAIADVVFGSYNPAAKLPMTFPRAEGQIPIYYNYYNTGRPFTREDELDYVSAYTDLKNSPKYPFGYGLSYTNFEIKNLKLSSNTLKTSGDTLKITVDVANTGNYDGEEVIQLYIRDLVGSVVRPVKELKGFKKIFLQKGQKTQVEFELTPEQLSFYNDDLDFIFEEGVFDIFVGNSSTANLKASFELIK